MGKDLAAPNGYSPCDTLGATYIQDIPEGTSPEAISDSSDMETARYRKGSILYPRFDPDLDQFRLKYVPFQRLPANFPDDARDDITFTLQHGIKVTPYLIQNSKD